MKVLFVLGFSNPLPGAAWTRIGFLADAWSKVGHSIDVLGTFGYITFHRRGKAKIGNVDIFNNVFRMDLDHPLLFIMNGIFSLIICAFFLSARRPNVAIVSLPPGDVGLGALVACRLFRLKTVVDYRDEWEDYTLIQANCGIRRILYSLAKKVATGLYAKSQLVIAVTSNHMKALKQRGPTNLKLIPNGADVKTFKPLNNKKDNQRFTIVFSGGVGGYYSVIVVVRSLKKLVDNGLSDLKFRIVGRGEVQRVLSLANELSIANNVEYEGVTNDRAKVARLLAEADVGLIPYDDNPLWKNSLPTKFFEYCACGIPIIATAYEDSLLAQIIRKHEMGVVSPPMDEENLAEAIHWIYCDKSFRNAAGIRARAFIERNFDRNKIADQFLDLTEALV